MPLDLRLVSKQEAEAKVAELTKRLTDKSLSLDQRVEVITLLGIYQQRALTEDDEVDQEDNTIPATHLWIKGDALRTHHKPLIDLKPYGTLPTRLLKLAKTKPIYPPDVT
jgi:hypothetical protein